MFCVHSFFCFYNLCAFILSFLDFALAGVVITCTGVNRGGSVAEWLACWTQAQYGPGSNRSQQKAYKLNTE